MIQAGKDCDEDISAQVCLHAEQAALTEAEEYKKGLEANSPPDCLRQAAIDLLDGLTFAIAGLTKFLDGGKTRNSTEIDAANSDVSSGNEKLTASNAAIKAASC